MGFGTTLKKLRINAGMTQQQLADKLNVTKSVISYYEHKDKMPSPDVLLKISEIFDVSTDFLLGVERISSPQIDIKGLTDDDIVAVKALIRTLKKKNGM